MIEGWVPEHIMSNVKVTLLVFNNLLFLFRSHPEVLDR